MNIAFVGCGYVADLYMQTLGNHLDLRLLGAFDRDGQRMSAFASCHGVKAYDSLQALLEDPALDMVVNLTDPRSHAEVTRIALDAGKHVFSEKPLASTLEEAQALVELAAAKGLHLACAPCTHLSEGVQTLARALRAGKLGRPLVAYAEMDTGRIPAGEPGAWRSLSGAPWPAKDEYELGCALGDAGYQLAPLVQLFGPVRRVTALSACRLPEKGESVGAQPGAPDLSMGLLEFDDGVVARLSVSTLAPADRSLRVVGSSATATLGDVWDFPGQARMNPVGSSIVHRALRKAEAWMAGWAPGAALGTALVSPKPSTMKRTKGGGPRLDFARGISVLAEAVRGGSNRLPTSLTLHLMEVSLALQAPAGSAAQVMRIQPDVPPLFDWAQG
ncbi:Gfo/Idh/MocA family protein [Pararhodospirillum oryzae]|uniref:Oxidoreductase n=1 Tax=Pararhodospirillum oryzae TaxID=478448 RepID=A0A512HBX6_9PROT|nr:Gfo/Idh/MocA family oxidoreductase [Pararhodospirillum oryzae]GEO82951.1 oxidoreductase [Pararhodospirillum oryzae]